MLRPVFLSAFIVLAHIAIKSYDLVVALTSGGPGGSAWLPSNFMYEYTFKRNEMAVGSASAVIMLMTIAAIIVPYLYSELREKTAMSAVRAPADPPSGRSGGVAAPGLLNRIVIYGLLALFALFYLMPLFVMLVTSFKTMDEIQNGNMLALPQAADLRAVAEGLGRDLRRPHLRRHQGLFLELHQDGGSRRR